ncbi:pepsin A [Hordeum vulgare]|nr:pepsin A [Hordeum vulgare]
MDGQKLQRWRNGNGSVDTGRVWRDVHAGGEHGEEEAVVPLDGTAQPPLLLVASSATFLAGTGYGARPGNSARFDLFRLATASLADWARSDREWMAFITLHGKHLMRETVTDPRAAMAFVMPLTSGAYTSSRISIVSDARMVFIFVSEGVSGADIEGART